MTDNEIIKALEEELKTALTINHRFEESNDTENPDDHKFIALLINTIKLINRQKAEIERLKHNNIAMAQHSLILCQANYIEGVKDFAKRFKEKYKNYVVISMAKINNGIDNLVKEMEGESDV